MEAAGFRKLRIAMAAGLAGSSAVASAPPVSAAAQGFPAKYSAGNSQNGSSWAATGNWLYPGGYPFGTGYGLQKVGIRGTDLEQVCTFLPPSLGGTQCHWQPVQTDLDVVFSSGSFLLQVNEKVYKAPNGVIDVNGNTFTSSSKLSGFKVEYRIVFLGNRRAAILYSFKNPKAVTKKATVEIASELSMNDIESTESGDQTLSVIDSWFELYPANRNQAPVMTIARGDCNGCARSSIVRAPGVDSTNWVERYVFRIKPNKTKRLLFFVELSEDDDLNPLVFNDAANLEAEGLLSSFTAKQRSQVVNWKDLG